MMNNSIMIFLYLLFCGISCQSAVSWSTITANELANLPDSDFKTITKSKLSSIPPNACTGFKSSQISEIPSTATSGFFKNQTKNIRGGYEGPCYGFTSSNFKTITPIAFSGFTQNQIKALNPNSQGACSGITALQIYNLGNDSAKGFTYDCISVIPSTSFMGFLNKSLSQLNVSAVPAITQAQMKNIHTSSFSGFTQDQIKALNPNSQGACSGIKTLQIYNLGNDSAKGFTYDCISVIPSTSFMGFLNKSLSQLNVSAVPAITQAQMKNIHTSSFSGFTQDQIKVLNPNSQGACSGITALQIYNLGNDSAKGFTYDCISVIPSTSFMGFLNKSLSQLNVSAVPAINRAQMQNIYGMSFSGFNASQISNFNSDYQEGCYGILAVHISNVTVSQTYGFVSACLSVIPAISYTAWTAQSVILLTTQAIPDIDGAQMGYIPPTAFVSWSQAQISAFNNSYQGGCYGITNLQLSQIKLSSFSGFLANCLSDFSSETVFQISADQIKEITPGNISGFNNGQTIYFQNSTLKAISEDQLKQLSASFISGLVNYQWDILLNLWKSGLINDFSSSQVSSVNGDMITLLKKQVESKKWDTILIEFPKDFKKTDWLKIGFSKLDSIDFTQNFFIETNEYSPKSISGVRKDQVSKLGNNLKWLNQNSLPYLLPDTTSYLSGSQVAAIPSTIFAFWDPNSFGSISKEAIPSLTESQIKAIPYEFMGYIKCSNIDSYTSTQISYFTQIQKNNYDSRKQFCIQVTTRTDSTKSTSETVTRIEPTTKVTSVTTIEPTTKVTSATKTKTKTTASTKSGSTAPFTQVSVQNQQSFFKFKQGTSSGSSTSDGSGNTLEYVLISIGSLIAVLLIVGVAGFWYMRNKRTSGYQLVNP